MDVPVLWGIVVQFTVVQQATTTREEPGKVVRKKWQRL